MTSDYDSFGDQNTSVVIDNGSGTIKAGMAGDNMPSIIMPTLIATPKKRLPPAWRSQITNHEEDGEKFFGDVAHNVKYRAYCDLHYPIKNGIITNFADATLLWQYIYKQQLQISMNEHPILFTEAPNNPLSNRIQISEILFEQRSVPALFFAPPAILSLYAGGSVVRTSGCVLDCGEGVTSCVPIVDGFTLPHAVQRSNIAGECITDQLVKLLKLNANDSDTYRCLDRASTKENIKTLKEERCAFLIPNSRLNRRILNEHSMTSTLNTENINADSDLNVDDRKLDLDLEQDLDMDEMYVLPDGNSLDISVSKYRACEVLFNPGLIGSEEDGIAQLLINAVEKCDLPIRGKLYSNIILSGGSTLIQGFGARLVYSLQKKKPNTKFRVYAPNNRAVSAWIGGSLLSMLPTFRPMWIRNKDYREYGERILLRKSMLL